MARILVVGDRTLGDAPGNLSPAALRLARNSGLDLLELRFQRPADGSTEWVFVDAVTMPELESAGEIEAVAMHLARSEREVQSRAAVEHLGAHA